MRVTNHQKENYTTVPGSSSIMRGTITMSLAQYNEAKQYLQKSKTAKHQHIYWPATQNQSFCIGVHNTQMLFKKYHLPRYKDQNYRIVINNK